MAEIQLQETAHNVGQLLALTTLLAKNNFLSYPAYSLVFVDELILRNLLIDSNGVEVGEFTRSP